MYCEEWTPRGSMRLLVCEPQCCAFEHAHFNAALLHTLLLAFPDATIMFLAEEQHLAWVRQITIASIAVVHAQRVEWRSLSVPTRTSYGIRRFLRELDWSEKLLRDAVDQCADLLFVCSITSSGLLALKICARLHRSSSGYLVVLHSMLGEMLVRQSRKPWKWLLDIRQVFRILGNDRFRYIVLGESILRNLVQIQPHLADFVSALDHPYEWQVLPTEQEIAEQAIIDKKPTVVRFGFLGVANRDKGFDTFARLARETQIRNPQAEFALVGFVNDPGIDKSYAQSIKNYSTSALSSTEYHERAKCLTYVIGAATPSYYQLVASASFIDALSYVKPGIFLRNPYLEYYFERMGDIGYLCDTNVQMYDTIQSIVEEFPLARYQQQCRNIVQARKRFSPWTLAPQVKAVTSHFVATGS